MRELDFAPNDVEDKRYMVVFNALCFAHAELDGRNELGVHRKLLAKIKAVGVLVNPNRSENESAVFACPAGAKIIITEPEYQILKRFLVSYIKNIMRVLTDELGKAIEWADNLPEKKDPTKK